MTDKIGQCEFKIVTTPEGKRHLESSCLSKEAARELQQLLEEEVIIRVKPAGAVQEEEPVT